MFTRIVECRARTGKAKEFITLLQEKVLPILQKQPGFMDEIVLTSNSNPERVVGLSFWNSEADAERYRNEQYPKIEDLMMPLLQGSPEVETFSVDIFSTHKILAKAA